MNRVQVLAIEDDPSLQELLRVTFEVDERVSSIDITPTAEKAIGLAGRRRPDVVIADSVVGADGVEVGARLRELLPEARVISFSGRDAAPEWADGHVDKAGDCIPELTRTVFLDPPVLGKDELRRFVHDIRNPIGALKGFSFLLSERREKLSDRQLEDVIDGMKRTADKLSALVEEFSQRVRQM